MTNFSEIDLYPVITPDLCAGRFCLDVLEATLKGGAKIIQLRDKSYPERYAADFRKLTYQYGALLIINDSVELALQYQADGVHLGQGDLAIDLARRQAPDLIIGASTHNLAEALAAQAAGASYVNLAPIFYTQSKNDLEEPVGLEGIKKLALHVSIPFTVMGGINLSNIDQVLRAGARRVAMITGVTQAADVELTTKKLIKLILGF